MIPNRWPGRRARRTPSGGATIFAAYIEARDGDSYRYVVTEHRRRRSRAHGPAGPDRAGGMGVPAPGVGTDRFRRYLNGSSTAAETHVFESQRCLVVTKSCQRISFFNLLDQRRRRGRRTTSSTRTLSGDFGLQPGASPAHLVGKLRDMFDLELERPNRRR